MVQQREADHSIEQLPRHVVEKLAAGEVIPNLKAVVRELVENSLDAGATELDVYIKPAEELLVIVDNGAGMSVSDLAKCACFNYTSKIRTVEDLQGCRTLGFRGQGLAAIAQQSSEITITTRDSCGNPGYSLLIREGIQREPVVGPALPGTKVVVFQLLCGPRGTMSFSSKAVKDAVRWFQHAFLCHLHCTARIRVSGQPTFMIAKDTLTSAAIHQILCRRHRHLNAQTEDMLSDYLDLNEARVALTLGVPDRIHTARGDFVLVAVNGRIVRIEPISKELVRLMRDWLPPRRYPVAFVAISCAANLVDWNIAPSKEEVRLHCIDEVMAVIPALIRSCFAKRTRPWASGASQTGRPSARRALGVAVGLPDSSFISTPLDGVPVTEGGSVNANAGLAESSVFLKNENYRSLGQVYENYVLVELNESLLLIEQHTAHERVLFERFQENLKNTISRWSVGRRVMIEWSEEIVERWANCGISVSCGTNIREIDIVGGPSFLEELGELELIRLLICLADETIDGPNSSSVNRLLADLACRLAYKNGKSLSNRESSDLASNFIQLGCPPTCPHGRPTTAKIASKDELANTFQRRWRLRGTLDGR